MSEDIRAEVGFLVLADISGFTAFVTASELEHGAWVTGQLLEAVMRGLAPPLEIQELEGDAVFALGPDRLVPDGSALPPALAAAVGAFKERQRRMARENDCACSACSVIAALDLKLIVHHGRFARQRVGGRARVAGPDVILLHRLLKNPVGGRAYVLLTEPALARIGVDPAAHGMARHVVSYPHLGEVPCFVAALEPAATALAGERLPHLAARHTAPPSPPAGGSAGTAQGCTSLEGVHS